MTSVELITLRSEAERLTALGAESTALRLIYNRHGDEKDAEASIEHVQPDSVVFLEGFSLDREAEPYFEKALLSMNEFRLQNGKDDAGYVAYKQAILSDVEANVDYEPVSELDFTRHGLARIKGLLEKDCLVYYADHKDLAAGAISVEEADSYNQDFRAYEEHICNVWLPDIAIGSGIARAIKALRTSAIGAESAHALREHRAVLQTLVQIGSILSRGIGEDLARDSHGKLITSVLYGTAHARSLTWHFKARGVQPQLVEVNSIAEHSYIDPILEPGYNNIHRRVGHYALTTLSCDLLQPESARVATEETYAPLAYLNNTGEEERMKFLVACASAMREQNRNPDEAYRQYAGILRSFMPNPEEFIDLSAYPDQRLLELE